jgi:hypothetical protein
MKIHLMPLVTSFRIARISANFESLHEIPLIFGAIDGSHISIIIPKVDPKSYYCRKEYYSTLIQRIIDAKCMFWSFDYGWARSIQD